MKQLRHKLFQTKATSIDEDTLSATFTISTDEPDRYGDVVDQNSWNFSNYLTNNLVLWGHDPSEPENCIGLGPDIVTGFKTYKTNGVTRTDATLTFDKGNPKAVFVFGQIMRGVLKTVSVGFRNHSLEWDDDTPILKDNELLEISVVPIPANQGAVVREFRAGNIRREDAEYLLSSMRKESELLDHQLKLSDQDKEKNMTDEQAQAVIDGMAKLTATVETLTADNQALRDEVAALKPVEETDEEKTAREAQEAAAKAEADKKIADDAEAARIAAEEAEKKDPAKDGSDDQSGAGDDFDDETEITAEEQAEIDAELEALAAV